MSLGKTTNLLIPFVLGGLTAYLISWLFKRLFRFDAAPEERGLSTHYRFKPMMRFLLATLACTGIAGLWFGTRQSLHGTTAPGVISICLGIAAIAMVIMTTGHEIILDEQGIHSHSLICPDNLIAWADLSHVEKFYNTRAVTTNYYIRSTKDTTITIGDSFNVDDLLRRIRVRHPLPERPYKRRRWYGS
jgi:hypothetical protein